MPPKEAIRIHGLGLWFRKRSGFMVYGLGLRFKKGFKKGFKKTKVSLPSRVHSSPRDAPQPTHFGPPCSLLFTAMFCPVHRQLTTYDRGVFSCSHHLGNLLHSSKVIRRGDRESGFNDVHSKPRQLLGNLRNVMYKG